MRGKGLANLKYGFIRNERTWSLQQFALIIMGFLISRGVAFLVMGGFLVFVDDAYLEMLPLRLGQM